MITVSGFRTVGKRAVSFDGVTVDTKRHKALIIGI